MSVIVDLIGVNGEKNSQMTLDIDGAKVTVGKQEYPVQYTSQNDWKDVRSWHGKNVSFELFGDEVKITVIVHHHIINHRKAEFQVARETLRNHIDAVE